MGVETHIPTNWRLRKQRYSLVGEICPHCDNKMFPPRDICPDCGQDAKTIFNFSGRGTVYSVATVHDAPVGFEEFTPYTAALIQLEEGPMVTAQLTDLDKKKVEIGTPVEMVTRKLKVDGDERGLIVYGYKFRPVLETKSR